MVTRRVSEDFYEVLANASGYQYTQLQKLIYPVFGNDWESFLRISTLRVVSRG